MKFLSLKPSPVWGAFVGSSTGHGCVIPIPQNESLSCSSKRRLLAASENPAKPAPPANHAPHVTKSLSRQIESAEPMFV